MGLIRMTKWPQHARCGWSRRGVTAAGVRGVLVLCFMVFVSTAASAQVTTHIATDGSLPGTTAETISGDTPIHVIDEDNGYRPGGGSTLLYSFDTFDLEAGDVAAFVTGVPTGRIVSRVTGSSPSHIDGTLRSAVAGADFYFLSRNGVIFGESAVLDLSGEFHISTADHLAFQNGEVFETNAGGAFPTLAVANPVAFGFLGGADRQVAFNGASLANQGGFSVRAGSVQLREGARLSTQASGISGAGAITIEATDAISLSGINAGSGSAGLESGTFGSGDSGAIDLRADLVSLQDGAVVTSSSRGAGNAGAITVDGRVVTVLGDESGFASEAWSSGRSGPVSITGRDTLIIAGGKVRTQTRGGPGGQITLNGGDIFLESVDIATVTESASPYSPAGDIEFNGDHLVMTNFAWVDASTVGPSRGGDIRINVDDLSISKFSYARSISLGSGDLGDVTVRATTISLDGAAVLGTYVAGSGNGGVLDVEATQRIDVSGVTCLDEAGCFQSQFVSFGGIGSSGDSSAIRISAPILSIDGGGIVESGSVGTGSGGPISIDVDQLRVAGRSADGNVASEISSASEFAGPSGDIHISADSIEVVDGGTIQATTRGVDSGGEIRLDVGELKVGDGASISARSEQNTTRDTAPLPEDLGAAGSIRIGLEDGEHSTRSVHVEGGSISTYAEVGPDPGMPREGNIRIDMDGKLFLDAGGTIDSSVGEGLGGNIDIRAQEWAVLRGASEITAETARGEGGRIEITSDVLIKSADSRISADAGEGVNGEVVLNSPVTRLEDDLVSLDTPFLDPSSRLKQACSARTSGEAMGTFRISHRGRPGPDPDGYLMAFDGVEGIGRLRSLAHEGVNSDVPGQSPATSDAEELSQGAESTQAALALASFQSGEAAYRGRRYDVSARDLEAAADQFAEERDIRGEIQARQALGSVEQARGHIDAAFAQLRSAVDLAKASGDIEAEATTLGKIAHVYLWVGDAEQARHALDEGLALLGDDGASSVAAGLLTNLGNLNALEGSFEAALRMYLRAAELASEVPDIAEQARALTSAGRAAVEMADLDEAGRRLGEAMRLSATLPLSSGRGLIEVHLARSYEQLARLAPSESDAYLLSAHRALTSASTIAQHVGDHGLLSEALGQMARLYEVEHRINEALYLTRRAIAESTQTGELGSSHRWHRQEGRLLFEMGDANAAIEAYRRAIEILEATQQDMLSEPGELRVHFRRNVAPIYQELTEVLLSSSALVSDQSHEQVLLREARDTVEKLRGAELRNHFRDECVAALEARRVDVDAVARDTAIVYPIIFPDRLELLISVDGRVERRSVGVGEGDLTDQVSTLRSALEDRTKRGYLRPGRRLHTWLVEPYEELLKRSRITTLVFVPGGILHSIPMSTLHDGDRFLADRYAVGVTPSFSVLDPRPIELDASRILMAGVSEGVQGYSPLPLVGDEFAEIQELYEGTVLLDAEFDLEQLRDEMQDLQPAVLHLASHATFSGDARSSFILTHGDKVTMDELSAVVRDTRFRETPLELLVLSACETAAGDERSALGLAGVALRAGARSAIGSLWLVSDEATKELITEFYRQLHQGAPSKAVALQRAQLALRQQEAFEHPYYWSSFLLIGNWL